MASRHFDILAVGAGRSHAPLPGTHAVAFAEYRRRRNRERASHFITQGPDTRIAKALPVRSLEEAIGVGCPALSRKRRPEGDHLTHFCGDAPRGDTRQHAAKAPSDQTDLSPGLLEGRVDKVGELWAVSTDRSGSKVSPEAPSTRPVTEQSQRSAEHRSRIVACKQPGKNDHRMTVSAGKNGKQ